MLGLPAATLINKQLSKRALFDKFKPKAAERKLFDEQISRLSIIAEISPQTVALAADTEVAAVYVVLITLKTSACDERNIAILSKLIDQHMLFVLRHGDNIRLAARRAGKILVSETKPVKDWELNLRGLNLRAVWDNIIAEIGGIELAGGGDLDAAIAEKERRARLAKQIEALEKKAMSEKQPRKKWEYAEEAKRLKDSMEGS